MHILCFDISSGGISAALFDAELGVKRSAETPWKLESDPHGAAVLPAGTIIDHFKTAIRQLRLTAGERIDAICIDTFMHNCVLLDAADNPLTPVFTWLDYRGADGVEFIRARMGDSFHERTGCRFHAMFPVFKLASMRFAQDVVLSRTRRIVSIKCFIVHQLTGVWTDDHGLASSSGLFNLQSSSWDFQILDLLELPLEHFPGVTSRNAVVGHVGKAAASSFALTQGTPVINGTGDGFAASVGSGCESPEKVSVTLGTSAVTRQMFPQPVVNSNSGTFCYMADHGAYLLGCAGSNGGNVLDWGRSILGTSSGAEPSTDPPIFLPLLHGERSPEWNPNLTGSWHRLTARHTPADLSRSILEGVIFNLAHFVEIVQKTSRTDASSLVLSGNGFLHPLAAPLFAAVGGVPVFMPENSGVMSLRGAAVCALRAMGSTVPPLKSRQIAPLTDPKILARYAEYRRFRGNLAPAWG
jgi:gluconokinase